MRRACVLFCCGLLTGCASLGDERARDYNEDGVYLFRQGKYPSARESFEAALALNPDDPGLLFNLGECTERLGDVAAAERYYRACYTRAPKHAACRHALVVLLVRQNRRPEAVQFVQAWLAGEPGQSGPLAEDGWLRHQAGDLPGAQERLQQALQIEPHNVRALTEMALVYEDMHRQDRALVLYERALSADPKDAAVAARVNFLLAGGVKPPHPE